MGKTNLTDRFIKSRKGAGKPYEEMDSVVPGLGLRVMPSGHKTFVLIARYPGHKQPARRALGTYDALTLEKARDKARDWIALLKKGVDPAIEEERKRQAERRKQANSFAVVAEEFIRRHVSKTRKAAIVEREIRREFIDRWGVRPITDITSHDVVAVLDEAVERGAPYQAHNLLGHVRTLFNWAIGRDVYGLERSPCDRLKPGAVIGKKALRTRILKDDEVRAFWTATGTMGYPFGPLYRLLALTIQRKSEVSDAQWPEFDLDAKQWTIPAERMKADAPHVVPLSDEAVEILKALPRFKKGDYLFSTTFGAKPVSGFSKAKRRLDGLMLDALRNLDPKRAKLADWVIHDIRRTGRTGLSALPISDLVRELVIAHTKPGLHKVYDQYAYLDEKRQALDMWAARLRSMLEPAPANVVQLRGAR